MGILGVITVCLLGLSAVDGAATPVLKNDLQSRGSGANTAEILVTALRDESFVAGGALEERDSLSNKKLRIMPLGDSITWGVGSSDGNSYRYDLLKLLNSAGNTVNMVGSTHSGSMANNDNEGHSGYVISQIAAQTSAYNTRPNVALLHAGTNDMNAPTDPDTAPQRLDALVSQLFTAFPDATIARGTHHSIEDVYDYGPYRNVQPGHRTAHDGPPGGRAALGDRGHGKRPLSQAAAKGWIQDPVPSDAIGPHRVFCSTNPAWNPQGQIATGAGVGSSLFATQRCSHGSNGNCQCDATAEYAVTSALATSTDACDVATLHGTVNHAIHFADLNGDGRAEFLFVEASGRTSAWLNQGGPDQGSNAAKISWLSSGEIATGVGAPRGKIHFADINGDGRADYLVVNDNGSVDMWMNMGGPDNGANAAKVGWSAQGTIAAGIGKDGAGVRFADLDGDGRADYLYLYDNGAVEAYLNLGGPDQGPNAGQVSWRAQGIIATGVGRSRAEVILADVNGDGRADYITIDRTATDSAASVWINGGGPSANPAQVTWLPQGVIATGVQKPGYGVHFADLTGDSRAEYLWVDFDSSATNAWLNMC
ncbi:integrin alpha N-terminal domain-containing protein [Thozetella sp. PMI_491]|nr:integrin alpha N-terminal domain-containing protein [Thozetella sp. PMI_491]